MAKGLRVVSLPYHRWGSRCSRGSIGPHPSAIAVWLEVNQGEGCPLFKAQLMPVGIRTWGYERLICTDGRLIHLLLMGRRGLLWLITYIFVHFLAMKYCWWPCGINDKLSLNSQMPRHLISDAHEWINEIPTVPIYYLAKSQSGERARNRQRGKKTLLSLTLV